MANLLAPLVNACLKSTDPHCLIELQNNKSNVELFLQLSIWMVRRQMSVRKGTVA